MKSLSIHGGNTLCHIYIEQGMFLKSAPRIASLSEAKKAVILTEEGLDKRYGYDLVKSLEKEGMNVQLIAVSTTQKSRSLSMVGRVYDALVNFGLGASDVIISLGGRVISDVAGFTAATYRRGIRYIAIPTSVVSQVSASIDGTVTIDIPAGRGLIGTYYQPTAVFIDPDLLKSLPRRYLLSGLSDAVRIGACADKGLFDGLSRIRDVSEINRQLPEIIGSAASVTAAFVEKDPLHKGERRKLDLGATLGAALERYYRFDDLSMTHGEAEAIGMAVITRNSEALGLTKKGTYETLCRVLESLGLPITVHLPLSELMPSLEQDPMIHNDEIQLTILKEIGTSDTITVPFKDLSKYVSLK